MGYYTSLGGTRPRGTSSSTGSSTRALAAAAKAQEAHALNAALSGILELHRCDFPPVRPPVAPAPPEPDISAITAKHRAQAMNGVGRFDRSGRAAAKAAAERAAEAEIASIRGHDARLHSQYQDELNEWWTRLLANDPATVLGVLAQAFEDNEATAAAVGVTSTSEDDHSGEASLVVLVPDSSAVPDRRPATTPAGNLTLKRLTKREAADFYTLLVCGFVLATVKEAFSVAPGLGHIRIVAMRASARDAYGRPRVEALLAARFARLALDRVRWQEADAGTVVNDTSEHLTLRQVGPSKQLAPLDLAAEPDVAALVAAIDVDDLTA